MTDPTASVDNEAERPAPVNRTAMSHRSHAPASLRGWETGGEKRAGDVGGIEMFAQRRRADMASATATVSIAGDETDGLEEDPQFGPEYERRRDPRRTRAP